MTEIGAEFIEKIQELVVDAINVETIEIAGRTYHTGSAHLVKPPKAESVKVSTLNALVGFIAANRDQLDLARHLLVCTEDTAALFGPLNSERERETPIVAVALKPPSFTDDGGGWMTIETTLIYIGTQFVADDAAEALVGMISRIDTSENAEIRDDGFAQSVTMRTGVATRGLKDVPNPVTLRPFATFPEIDQPSRRFLLRLRKNGNSVQCRLIPTGEGLWKLKTRALVADFLTNAIKSAGAGDVAVVY